MKLFINLFCSCTIITSTFAVIDISNLPNCTLEVEQNKALPVTQPPLFTTNYQSLLMTLQAQSIRASFPTLYQQSMLDPFLNYLQGLGAAGFNAIFLGQRPSQQSQFLQEIIPDVAEALLQSGNLSITKPTNAFEEVVSDLYEGFLSDERRRSTQTGRPIKPPDRGVIPPLVKWGKPENGPYTWPADATAQLRIGAAVVSLPPNNAQGGLLAWTALPHETAGHDIIHADIGLLPELGNLVYNAIITQLSNNVFLANYWKSCIDETTSDIVGLLHSGPTTGIGLVGYFRGLMGGKLRSTGSMPPADAHPLDILRGYMAARVVSQMPFDGALDWSNAILQEVQKDQQMMVLIDRQRNVQYNLVPDIAIKSAQIVADTIMNSKLSSLEGNSLSDIRIWDATDQATSEALGALLQSGVPLTDDYKNNGFLAAHVVAGATLEALKANADITMLFNNMIDYLDTMNQYDSIWATDLPQAPVPVPVPPPAPTPTPTPGSDDFSCLWQCFQQCKNNAKAPQLSTHAAEIALSEEMVINQ